jgi:hypothetical protein
VPQARAWRSGAAEAHDDEERCQAGRWNGGAARADERGRHQGEQPREAGAKILSSAFRVLAFVLPVFAYFLTKSICQELRERELRPLREFSGVAETAPEREREPSV